jgi:hypothetical protein
MRKIAAINNLPTKGRRADAPIGTAGEDTSLVRLASFMLNLLEI